MEQSVAPNLKEVLTDVRSRLKLKRGYGLRIAKKLKVTRFEVYNVAWGKSKNPMILQALVDEAIAHESDPNQEIITKYLKAVA